MTLYYLLLQKLLNNNKIRLSHNVPQVHDAKYRIKNANKYCHYNLTLSMDIKRVEKTKPIYGVA